MNVTATTAKALRVVSTGYGTDINLITLRKEQKSAHAMLESDHIGLILVEEEIYKNG